MESQDMGYSWLCFAVWFVLAKHMPTCTHTKKDCALWTEGKNYIPTRQSKGKMGRFSLIYNQL